MSSVPHPIEGQIVLLAGARASVTLDRLSELLHLVQDHLDGQGDGYERQYERIDGSEGLVYYFVPSDHWEAVGEAIGLADREIDAVRRAHEAQFERDGRRLDRSEEFDSALEIRDVVAMPD
jgi:GTP cyclohydrolase II